MVVKWFPTFVFHHVQARRWWKRSHRSASAWRGRDKKKVDNMFHVLGKKFATCSLTRFAWKGSHSLTRERKDAAPLPASLPPSLPPSLPVNGLTSAPLPRDARSEGFPKPANADGDADENQDQQSSRSIRSSSTSCNSCCCSAALQLFCCCSATVRLLLLLCC